MKIIQPDVLRPAGIRKVLRVDSKTIELRLTLNGEARVFQIGQTETLLEVIRERAGLTGTKRGCDNGQCGACTVILNGRAVNSCCLLAVQCEGAVVETVEALAKNGVPHPIQEAFVEQHAIQCGFCTPGMEMATKALLDRNPNPDSAAIKEALSGNVCRCTGYVKIEDAVRAAAGKLRAAHERV